MKQVTKSLIAGVFASGVLAFGFTMPALADTPGAVGSWLIEDHGQGCRGGGSLFADGSMTGVANCVFSISPGDEEVATIIPTGWSWADSAHTEVTLGSNLIGEKGTAYPIGQPVPVPITLPVGNFGAPILLGSGSSDYVKVNMFD